MGGGCRRGAHSVVRPWISSRLRRSPWRATPRPLMQVHGLVVVARGKCRIGLVIEVEILVDGVRDQRVHGTRVAQGDVDGRRVERGEPLEFGPVRTARNRWSRARVAIGLVHGNTVRGGMRGNNEQQASIFTNRG